MAPQLNREDVDRAIKELLVLACRCGSRSSYSPEFEQWALQSLRDLTSEIGQRCGKMPDKLFQARRVCATAEDDLIAEVADLLSKNAERRHQRLKDAKAVWLMNALKRIYKQVQDNELSGQALDEALADAYRECGPELADNDAPVPLGKLRANSKQINKKNGPKQCAALTVQTIFPRYAVRDLYRLQAETFTFPADFDCREAALNSLLPCAMAALGFSEREIKVAVSSIASTERDDG